MQLIELKCPDCGASLEVEDNRKNCFCTYCGAKIMLHDENEKTVNINKNLHITNEAEIVRIKEESKNENKRDFRLFFIIVLGLILLCILPIIGSYFQ